MTPGHEDSILTSIRELQRIEEERQRDDAYRAEAAEREAAARLEAARLEAEREATARAVRLEAERDAEQRRRNESERRIREVREARELAIRAESDAASALRAERLVHEHAQTMAAIEAVRDRNVHTPQVIAMVLGAVALTGALGWFGVYVPQQRRHAEAEALIAARTQTAQREGDRARHDVETLAERLRGAVRTAAPELTAVTAASSAPRNTPRTTPRTTPRVQGPSQSEPIDTITIDDNDDPFAMDDGVRSPHRGTRRR